MTADPGSHFDLRKELVAIMAKLEVVPEDWDTALAIVAHPDDLEYGSASAIARWTSQGKHVYYLLVTAGEAGIEGMTPEEAAPLRREEQISSSKVVGVESVDFLDHRDGLVEASLDLRRDLAREIRRRRPDVLIGINFREHFGMPGWNHVDHRNVGTAMLDAARDAANSWVFPELTDEGFEPWAGVRMALFGGSPEPTHYIDVTEYIDHGVRSLKEHKVYLEALREGTPGKEPESFIKDGANAVGTRVGVEYAVAFEVIPL